MWSCKARLLLHYLSSVLLRNVTGANYSIKLKHRCCTVIYPVGLSPTLNSNDAQR